MPTLGALPNRLQLPLLGNCSTWMHSRLTQDRSNLSIPAWQSWRTPRPEHSCLIYIVNILSVSSRGVSSPFPCGFGQKMAPLLPPKQTSAAEPPGLGDTLGHGDVLGGHRTAQSLGVPSHCLVSSWDLPIPALWILQCRLRGMQGGDAQTHSGVVQQKCRILTQIQTPAGRGVRGIPGGLERAKEGEKAMQERGPGATAPPEQGTHLHPVTGAPSLASAGYTGS